MWGLECIGPIWQRCIGTSSCVLCRKVVLTLERPLSEVPLCNVAVCVHTVHASRSVHHTVYVAG